MILVNHCAIRPPIPKTIYIIRCRVEIMAFSLVLFCRDRFFHFLYLSRQRLSAAYLPNTVPPATTCSYSVTLFMRCYLSLLVGVCAACMLAYSCLKMKWCVAVTVVAIPLQKALWCAQTSPPANFQCSHRVVLASFCIICSLHLIAVWFLQAIWLQEWSLQLSSFLAFYVSKGLVCREHTSLRTLCFHFAVTWSLQSTRHMQGNWYCFALL